MNRLKEKLMEIDCKAKRDYILNNFDGEFSSHLKKSKFEYHNSLLKNLAYPKIVDGVLTTSRGNILSWRHFELKGQDEVVLKINELNFAGKTGWLTLASDIPFFKVDGELTQKYFDEIIDYVEKIEDWDIAWVCNSIDSGFIAEFSRLTGRYEFSVWGL